MSSAGGRPGPNLFELDQAGGQQAQAGINLQLMRRLVQAVEALLPSQTSVFHTEFWTVPGDLDIATAFPNLQAGTFIIAPGAVLPMTVTIPDTGGPWGIFDGTGTCAGGSEITIQPASITILGIATLVLNTPWASKLCINGVTNYVTLG